MGAVADGPGSRLPPDGDSDGSARKKSDIGVFFDGMLVTLSVPGLILLASSAGFGSLAKDAGMSLFNAIFMMGVFFALPAQVVMMDQLARGGSILAGSFAVMLTAVRLVPMMVAILPMLGDGKSPLWARLAAAHTVAVTAWLEGFKHLPNVPQSQRMTAFLGIGWAFILVTLLGTAIGFLAAATVPPMIAACLLFLTPVYFLLSLMATAKATMDHLAIVIGLVMGPLVYLVLPGFDLLITGLVGGTAAFVAGRHVDGMLEDDGA